MSRSITPLLLLVVTLSAPVVSACGAPSLIGTPIFTAGTIRVENLESGEVDRVYVDSLQRSSDCSLGLGIQIQGERMVWRDDDVVVYDLEDREKTIIEMAEGSPRIHDDDLYAVRSVREQGIFLHHYDLRTGEENNLTGILPNIGGARVAVTHFWDDHMAFVTYENSPRIYNLTIVNLSTGNVTLFIDNYSEQLGSTLLGIYDGQALLPGPLRLVDLHSNSTTIITNQTGVKALLAGYDVLYGSGDDWTVYRGETGETLSLNISPGRAWLLGFSGNYVAWPTGVDVPLCSLCLIPIIVAVVLVTVVRRKNDPVLRSLENQMDHLGEDE